MAEPPAVVVQTFQPIGALQFHRFGQSAHFYCVRCQKDKTDSLVATMDGDWAQTVCERCYFRMVHAQGKETRRAATAERRQAQANSRLPGAYGLQAFFRDAGVRAELLDAGLWINGSEVQRLARLPRPETLEWKKIVDEIVVKYALDEFKRAVEGNARFGEGLRISPQWSERGFAIMHHDVRLAIIHPTRAYISHRQVSHHTVIHANFLTPGPHWRQVADTLHSAEPELVPGRNHEREAKAAKRAAAAAAEAEAELRRTAARRRIRHLPNNLSPELMDACLKASRRIRLERQLAYDRPVILKSDVGELILLPIAGTATRLLIPFCLNKGTETLKGELVLGDHDPLPLLISKDVADEDATTAWTCALLGFADATCSDVEPVEPTKRRQSARPQWHPASSAPHRDPSTRALPRGRPWWPRRLEPVGHWDPYSGSYVAGHRRRLHDGQTASDEARDRARQFGIILHSHETWVQAHIRGVPDDDEIRFLWHAPTELELPFHT